MGCAMNRRGTAGPNLAPVAAPHLSPRYLATAPLAAAIFAFTASRLKLVQQQVEKLAMRAVEFPPMQRCSRKSKTRWFGRGTGLVNFLAQPLRASLCRKDNRQPVVYLGADIYLQRYVWITDVPYRQISGFPRFPDLRVSPRSEERALAGSDSGISAAIQIAAFHQ